MDIMEAMRLSAEHMSLSEEERKQTTIDAMWRATEEACKQITINRRSAELNLGISSEEFDARLNEICTEMNEKYGSMTLEEMNHVMLEEILTRMIKDLRE